MEQIAFTMQLLPGHAAEYKRRHDEIWPDLRALLSDSGVSDYSIFLDEESNVLFAVLRRERISRTFSMSASTMVPIFMR